MTSRRTSATILFALILPWLSLPPARAAAVRRAPQPEQAEPDPSPARRGFSLGDGHIWLRAGRIDLRESVENEWGLDRETFFALEGYLGRGYETYTGGEIGFASSDAAQNMDGDRLEDLHFRWGGLNVKHAFPMGHGLSFDAGAGLLLFYIDATEVSMSGGMEVRDPLADLGYGFQALGDFNWRYRVLVLGLDARFQYAFDLLDIDYSNFSVGAHLGVAF